MLDKLSKLTLEENALKRGIDCTFNKKDRSRMFKRLVQVQKEIKDTKSKLRIERMIKNEKSGKNI